MAAPKGNQFWKLRSKHGRDKLFASPKLLWEAACEYFNWVDGHPWYNVEGIKSGDAAGTLMKVPTARPYTLTALCLYLGCSENYFREFKRASKEEGFLTVIEQIEQTIYAQKFEGAAVGAFNSNIIARDLGLKDKTELSGDKDNPIRHELDLSSLTEEELRTMAAVKRKLNAEHI